MTDQDDPCHREQQLCQELKTQKQQEEETINVLQKTHVKIEVLLEQERARLHNLKTQLRERLNAKDDLHDHHNNMLREYRERFRYLLQENQGAITTQRIETDRNFKKSVQDQSSVEHDQTEEIRAVMRMQKEQSVKHMEFVFTLRREQEQLITETRERFMKRIDYLRDIFQQNLTELTQRREGEIAEKLQHLESVKGAQIENTIHSHDTAFSNIKNYFNDITHANLDLIKTLKGEVVETSREEKEKEQCLLDVVSVYRQFAGPLAKYLEEIETLKIKAEYHTKNEKELTKVRKKIHKLQKVSEEIMWQVELLKEKIAKKQAENELLDKKVQAQLQEIQQKESLKNLIMKEKLIFESQQLEKIQAVFVEILKRVGMENKEISTFEDCIDAKNNELAKLYQVLEERKEIYYNDINFWETIMKRHGIRLEELGFTPKSI